MHGQPILDSRESELGYPCLSLLLISKAFMNFSYFNFDIIMQLLSKRADRASDKEFSKDDLRRDYNIQTQFGTLEP